ncbi:MAG TPA: CDP-diacylglycerol--glycerol-3-phosphate 3-phosphatidyltransferase [Egibacteraceae bacterium]|nr:CDP-diacylglycerol--glycerol-3-phosphate 3-phosphatidyltransferase [Egibacteraceae bacterium]
MSPARRGSYRNPANWLTLLRVALVPLIAALLLAEGGPARWWALAVFGFAALTDSFDGWVARRRLGTTRWGQLADPAADKVLIVGTLAILAWLGEVAWWALAVIVVREVAVTVQRSRLAKRGTVMPASIFGKAKTVSQIVAVILILAPPVPEPFAMAALWIAVALTILSGLEYARRGGRLERVG